MKGLAHQSTEHKKKMKSYNRNQQFVVLPGTRTSGIALSDKHKQAHMSITYHSSKTVRTRALRTRILQVSEAQPQNMYAAMHRCRQLGFKVGRRKSISTKYRNHYSSDLLQQEHSVTS
jgi:hypothetical protein